MSLVIASLVMKSKISTRWQTVVPKEIREELGVGPDWTLSWEVRDGVAVVVPIPPDPVRALYGILKGRGGPTVADLLEERRRDRDREEAKEQRGWQRVDAAKVRKREAG
jgi:bifunctional DNA-binding transcriptional regulator/antitoxin component of YhaV-PrlF toxin-antitoxin module